MSQIRSKNTKPEETVRKYLFSRGFRYRKNVNKLPGKPDIVLPKYHSVIFVNGCFWHGHSGCRYFVMPKSNDCACCKTGRLRSGYGVEDIFRMLSGNRSYFEVHNALADAEDELEIMKMLGHDISKYQKAII